MLPYHTIIIIIVIIIAIAVITYVCGTYVEDTCVCIYIYNVICVHVHIYIYICTHRYICQIDGFVSHARRRVRVALKIDPHTQVSTCYSGDA